MNRQRLAQNLFFIFLCAVTIGHVSHAASANDLDSKEVARALERAVRFFQEEVSIEGGYLWKYSADLSQREGEGKADKTTAWVQPPGTPSVGSAFLEAYERTGDEYLLAAAKQSAHALAKGQLVSGGWDYRIVFDPKERQRYAYRLDGSASSKARNVTTLDDNTTQAALRFLMRLDKALESQDKMTHSAAEYALGRLLKAQYPNGAWPQRFSEPPDPSKYPVVKADYPESWSRTHPDVDYRSYYTFNDNTIADMIDTMFLAAEIYGYKQCREAAEKAGDFIILAQMPDPQPAWAQQYNAKMHPAWARKFEPASITGGESQGVMRILLKLYRQTGNKKYLEPIPRAVSYLQKSRLPGGQLARFYEFKTNRPLYFTKKYELTYRDNDLPTHYGFKVGSKLESIEREYEKLSTTNPAKLNPPKSSTTYRLTPSLTAQAKSVVAAMDERGAWLETGQLKQYPSDDPNTKIIDCRTFARNVDILSRYLAASNTARK